MPARWRWTAVLTHWWGLRALFWQPGRLAWRMARMPGSRLANSPFLRTRTAWCQVASKWCWMFATRTPPPPMRRVSHCSSAFLSRGAPAGGGVIVGDSWFWRRVVFDSGLRSQSAEAAAGFGYSHMELPSRAGHDALNMARVAPTAMIFIPCRAGLSHNELEFAEDQDIAAGADVLLAAALAAAR